jgi:nucleoside-triphosphatase
MDKGTRNLLITGEPGIGKTTLITKLAAELKALNPVGFYTAETRVDGVRKGFQLVSLDGRHGTLAHVDCRSPIVVGKYRVNVRAFEVFLSTLNLTATDGRLVIIDEIGKMECHSRVFRAQVEELLAQDRIVIATVAQNGIGLIEQVKQRDDIVVFEMMRRNREEMLGKVLRRIHQIRFS